uniref:Putative restriction alleviation protein n=1 Tax=viral metagenome TaxID=1070528 RepID=A0A6M3KNY6_9ZZZZ
MTDALTINPCPHCSAAPSLRENQETGFFLVACLTCKVYAATGSREYAIGSWNTFAEEQRCCLGCGGQPTLRNSRLRNMWVLACSGCNWQGQLSHTVQGAVSGWHTSNRRGESHIVELWNLRAEQLRAGKG